MNVNGSFIVTLIEFIVVLGILVTLHEFGHFLMAQLFHIEVEEFGLGLPPRMIKLFHWGKTDFTLNWIPFGAFVRPKGENDPEVPGGLGSAKPGIRLAVLFGGPVMNILIGLVLFSVMFIRIGAPEPATVEVIDVSPNSPASQAGLLPGDVIQKVNQQTINSMTSLQQAIQATLGKEVVIDYTRKSVAMEAKLTPRQNPPQGQGPLGIVMGNPYKPVGVSQAVPAAFSAAYDQAHQLVLLPVQLIKGQANPDSTRIVGPKGMFDIYSEAVKRDTQAAASPVQQPAVNVLWFMGTISIALGLTNLLPIPALDGGRIIFVLPELIFRRRVPAQYENIVHLIGFAALLLLMSYITIQDFAHPIVMP